MMTSINSRVDFVSDETINDYVKRGLITVRYHLEHPLRILNYTPKCAYDRAWDNLTLQTRGLVIDESGNVVARGPVKFFNNTQLDDFPIDLTDDYYMTRKEDGSLGIVFLYEGDVIVCTRGSFYSDQANWGNEAIHRLYPEFVANMGKRLTYWVELIYPENRIVLDYGGKERMVLLGCFYDGFTDTSEALYIDSIYNTRFHDIPLVKVYSGTIDDYLRKDISGEEGIVVFQRGSRVKIKYANYIKLHSIISEFTEKKMFQLWASSDKSQLTEYLQSLPDELYTEGEEMILKFDIDLQRMIGYNEAWALRFKSDTLTRKELALILKKETDHRVISAIQFQLYEGRDVTPVAIKTLKRQYKF